MTDLPLLVFGGKCLRTGVELQDAFSIAFSREANLNCWKKCGAVPLTRLPLLSKDIRHEVPVGNAASLLVGVAPDPEVEHLKWLESINQFYCDILNTNGYDGDKLRKEAPKRTMYVAVTEPHSKECIDAIKKAKTAGQMFFATGGRHINTNEFFQSKTLLERHVAIKAMEDAKKARAKYCKEQLEAVQMLKSKGELTHLTEKNFTLPEIKTLLKWKKVKPASSKKRDLVDAYIETPKPKIQKIWCRSEEAELQALKSTEVPLIDTALGIATTQMARAVTNNLAQLDTESMDALKTAIENFKDSYGPNVL